MLFRLGLYTFAFFACFVTLSDAYADAGNNCLSTQARVCFADNDCICVIRSVSMTDTAITPISCVDEDDEGICN